MDVATMSAAHGHFNHLINMNVYDSMNFDNFKVTGEHSTSSWL